MSFAAMPLYVAVEMDRLSMESYRRSIGATSLTDKDLIALSQSTRRVYELVRDGEWHSATSVIEASGTREGLRRLRELRKIGTLDTKRGEGREWFYKFTANKP